MIKNIVVATGLIFVINGYANNVQVDPSNPFGKKTIEEESGYGIDDVMSIFGTKKSESSNNETDNTTPMKQEESSSTKVKGEPAKETSKEVADEDSGFGIKKGIDAVISIFSGSDKKEEIKEVQKPTGSSHKDIDTPKEVLRDNKNPTGSSKTEDVDPSNVFGYGDKNAQSNRGTKITSIIQNNKAASKKADEEPNKVKIDPSKVFTY